MEIPVHSDKTPLFKSPLVFLLQKPRATRADEFPAVLQWEVEQWLGSVSSSVTEGLPSDGYIQLFQVSFKVRNLNECPDPKSVCKYPSPSHVYRPCNTNPWAAAEFQSRSSQDLFLGPGNASLSFLLYFQTESLLPYLSWCVCCKNPSSPALQHYQEEPGNVNAQCLVSCPSHCSQERPGKRGPW